MSIAKLIARRVLPGLAAVLLGAGSLWAQQPAPPAAAAPSPALNDLDAFMAKVLDKRNENWRRLHDYILNEREVFEVLGPLSVPLHSLEREFHWSIREGYLVRTPVKANGVAVSADDRAAYEKKWLDEEQRREKKAAEKAKKDAEKTDTAAADAPDQRQVTVSLTDGVEMSGFSGTSAEPRFISESYFMKFKFEPGNYYFAGREQLDGREVLKIEYLPSDLFSEERDEKKAAGKAEPGAEQPADKPGRKRDRKRDDADDDEKIERAMNKTSTVTMWIDPREYQVVRFTFDNVDWGFLPGRQLVRIDDARASMTMGLVFDGVWLPKDVTFGGSATFAGGTVRVRYAREFYDYRRGEVSARIRAYVPKEPE